MLPNDTEYRAILKCYERLCAQLHYPSVGPKLITSSVITMEAHEVVRAQLGSRAQNDKFLNFLAKNGSKAMFYKFLDILKLQPTFVDLVELLERSLEEVKDEIQEEEAAKAQSQRIGGAREGHSSSSWQQQQHHEPSNRPIDVDPSSPMDLILTAPPQSNHQTSSLSVSAVPSTTTPTTATTTTPTTPTTITTPTATPTTAMPTTATPTTTTPTTATTTTTTTTTPTTAAPAAGAAAGASVEQADGGVRVQGDRGLTVTLGDLQPAHVIVVILALGVAVMLGKWVSQTRDQTANLEISDPYYTTIEPSPPPPSLDGAPSMKHLRLYVIHHVATDWEGLADILLNSPNAASLTGQISANIPTVASRCAELFKTWLKMDPHADWSTLLAAVDSLGHKTLAKTLREKIQRQEL